MTDCAHPNAERDWTGHYKCPDCNMSLEDASALEARRKASEALLDKLHPANAR